MKVNTTLVLYKSDEKITSNIPLFICFPNHYLYKMGALNFNLVLYTISSTYSQPTSIQILRFELVQLRPALTNLGTLNFNLVMTHITAYFHKNINI